MKVLHLLASNVFSGAENVACQIINGLGDKVNSVYVSPNGTIGDLLKDRGINHLALEKFNKKNIKKIISEYNPDVIHAHDFKASLMGAVVSKKILVISHLHKNDPRMKKRGLLSVLYALVAKKLFRVITVSSSVMDEYIYKEKYAKKTSVLGNPVDTKSILSKTENIGAEKQYDLAFCGRLEPEKNPIEFVNICKEIKDIGIDIKAVMLGEGYLKEEIVKSIEKLGLKENVRLLGFVKNPYAELNTAKVMCVPSVFEGFGLVAVEGLSLGLPVVASEVGGLVDIVNDGCGMLCKTRPQFVEEIKLLLTEEDYYNKKSDLAKKRAQELDNVEEYMNEVYGIYQTACEKGRV